MHAEDKYDCGRVLRSSYFVDGLGLSSVGGCGSFFAKLQSLPWGLWLNLSRKPATRFNELHCGIPASGVLMLMLLQLSLIRCLPTYRYIPSTAPILRLCW
ncbi:hypothetical protein M441DRAFT_407225 [Trichoderma asperellum CBS 433.97]|uniref:Uncharacterized protein n=1 Tax=Trichoderma asperellum (strain ATCC 204424 / CBS 433.97 / NBRC 101777) TaxID=1042311 RepID=A0A2T3Z6S9_TRIA4|nr:hypothetical protein M441DRAFT_407225 [Trichoderma asperellum CBS 433.97]PTB40509.1 hypothetical protein M441DRAFT_407225 [Trichoderma asperellum CBS 433.97]